MDTTNIPGSPESVSDYGLMKSLDLSVKGKVFLYNQDSVAGEDLTLGGGHVVLYTDFAN